MGDEIVSISDVPYIRGTPLSNYLQADKQVYLCKVRREIKHKRSLTKAGGCRSRFGSEEEARRTYDAAGDFLGGVKQGNNRPAHLHSILWLLRPASYLSNPSLFW